SYTIECYVKTAELITSEGPRVMVNDSGSAGVVESSEPVASGSSEWRRLSMGFVAPGKPGESSAVYVSIKRKPKYSYDEPTKGSVWFDDFKMTKNPPPPDMSN
ncbi:MAG TPA: hypothetical protein VLU47_09615, partial [Blastocatellia bacterium]|nr:hypothetical protein [Blastocatellia bacterium]